MFTKKGVHTQKFKKCSKKKCAQTKVQKVFTKLKKNVCTHKSLKSGCQTLKSDYKTLKNTYKNLKNDCKSF